MEFIVKPTWSEKDNMISLPCKRMNHVQFVKHYNRFDAYQACFGIYDWLQKNDLNKYIIHRFDQSPFVWQKHINCTPDPLSDLNSESVELEGCKAILLKEWCKDSLFNSCFEMLMGYQGGRIDVLPGDGARFMNQLASTYISRASQGALLTLIAGGRFDMNVIEKRAGKNIPKEVWNNIEKTIGTCNGWLQEVELRSKVVGNQNLKVSHMKPSDFDPVTRCYTGDVLDLFDATREKADSQLQSIVTTGAIPMMGAASGMQIPIMVVDAYTYQGFIKQEESQCIPEGCTKRLMKKEKEYMGNTMSVLYIDNTLIVPVSGAQQYDQYFSGALHFAYLTLSKNIALGGSFNALPGVNGEGEQIGLRIQRGNTLKTEDEYTVKGEAQFLATINCWEYIAGQQLYVVSDK